MAPSRQAAIAAFEASEATTSMIMGLIWAGVSYSIGAIWFALELLRRWDRSSSRRDGDKPARVRNSSRHACGCLSLVAAFVLALAWPLVWLYMCIFPEPPELF